MPVERLNPIPAGIADPKAPIEFDAIKGVGPSADDEGEQLDNPIEEHYDNLVQFLEPELIKRIGKVCLDGFNKDLESRSEWEETIKRGIDNIGLGIEELNDPFEGACSATHPLILECMVKYQSKASTELLPPGGPAKTQIFGKETPEKLDKATRVKDFLNYQTTKVMTEYYPDMERLLFYQPGYGSAFKKDYWDSTLMRPVSCFVSSDSFVINANAKSLEKARRYTEILPALSGSELYNKIVAGDYIEPEEWRRNREMNSSSSNSTAFNYDVTGDNMVGGQGTFYINDVAQRAGAQAGQTYTDGTHNKVFTLLEQHCYLKLPEKVSGSLTADPYIVTFDKDTGTVLAIRRNWKEKDLNRKKRIWYVHYPYVPGFGFYGLGLFHLLGNFQATLTAVLRSLVDSGQFANLQGGFKLKGVRINGDNGAIAPGEWKEVESAIQDLGKAFFPVPYKEPSATLFELLKFMDARAGNFADSTEQIVGDSTNYGPVGTTVALLEASMKLFSAIHKRTHYAQEKDLKLIAELNYEYLPDEYPYEVIGESKSVFRSDFNPEIVDVIPVSDPNVHSQAQRMAIAQTILQAAGQAQSIHDMYAVYRNFYQKMGVDDPDKFLPPPPTATPLDPMGTIAAITQGKPVKAFPGQDHNSYVQFFMAWMQDGIVGGKTPTMQQFAPRVMANIVEHQVMQLQEQLGTEQTGVGSDPKTVAAIQAKAMAEVKKANEALAQMTAGDDPMHVIAQAEMLKAQTEADRVKHVRVKDLADLALKAQGLDIDRIGVVLKGRELGSNVQLEQFKTGLQAVQQGLQNLLQESAQKQDYFLENKKIETQKDMAIINARAKAKSASKKKPAS